MHDALPVKHESLSRREWRIVRRWDRSVDDALKDLAAGNVNLPDTTFRLEGLRDYMVDEYDRALVIQRTLWGVLTIVAFLVGMLPWLLSVD